MGNAELWYQALKALDVPAEFVRYPRSTHDLSRTGEPWLLVDRLSRIRQWFTYWLITNPAPSPAR
jgi:dipeptidyl aminopeptidase/acylaminoacyl peptidase